MTGIFHSFEETFTMCLFAICLNSLSIIFSSKSDIPTHKQLAQVTSQTNIFETTTVLQHSSAPHIPPILLHKLLRCTLNGQM